MTCIHSALDASLATYGQITETDVDGRREEVLDLFTDILLNLVSPSGSVFQKCAGPSLPLSYDSSIVSSPTAPLLTDHHTHTAQQLYPKASLYVGPAVSGASPANSQSGHPENQKHMEASPPPFAPLYNLLP
ncbi:hypothetical protein AOLI_G00092000 [Acnodon oligacanthus]